MGIMRSHIAFTPVAAVGEPGAELLKAAIAARNACFHNVRQGFDGDELCRHLRALEALLSHVESVVARADSFQFSASAIANITRALQVSRSRIRVHRSREEATHAAR